MTWRAADVSSWLFSKGRLGAWNQPRWEYAPHGDWHTPQISTPPPRGSLLYLPALHGLCAAWWDDIQSGNNETGTFKTKLHFSPTKWNAFWAPANSVPTSRFLRRWLSVMTAVICEHLVDARRMKLYSLIITFRFSVNIVPFHEWENGGTEGLRHCPGSNLLHPASGPLVWLRVYRPPFLPEATQNPRLCHWTCRHFKFQLIFISTCSAFSEMSFILWLERFSFPSSPLSAIAFNGNVDKALFFRVILPKRGVLYNLQQIINACDNPQTLHTLQQDDWEEFTSTWAGNKLQGKGLHPLPREPTLRGWHLLLPAASLLTVSAASVVTVRGKPRQGSASPRASANQHQRCVGHRSSGQNPAKNGDYLMLNPVFVERLNEGPYVLLSPREYVQRVTFDPLTVVKVKRKKRKEKKREEKRREEKRREEKRREEKRKEKRNKAKLKPCLGKPGYEKNRPEFDKNKMKNWGQHREVLTHAGRTPPLTPNRRIHVPATAMPKLLVITWVNIWNTLRAWYC